MDDDVIYIKLESLARCIKRIEEKSPKTLEELEKNIDLQDIIVLNLERAVQICVDIAAHILLDFDEKTPQSMAESFFLLEKHSIIARKLAENMAKSVGFRNLAVHQYSSLDWKIVFAIITKNLGDFRDFAAAIKNQIA